MILTYISPLIVACQFGSLFDFIILQLFLFLDTEHRRVIVLVDWFVTWFKKDLYNEIQANVDGFK